MTSSQPHTQKPPVLRTENLGITFGGLNAVQDFDIELGSNDLVGLIGPNGAGKTTVFNMLTGVYRPTAGNIYLDGVRMNGKQPHQFSQWGMARTFQNIRLFKDLSVMENVKIAYGQNMKYSIAAGIFRGGSFWKEEREAQEKCMELLEVFDLVPLADHMARNLPYGKQRKLEITRALATQPKVLLLDEPAAGMNPTETAELMETIALIRKRFDLTILLIEHDMSLVMGICERIVVLNYGNILTTGTPAEVSKNPSVIEAYLGKQEG
jgi:branched-chain amino acid transport system ATP-binding protein